MPTKQIAFIVVRKDWYNSAGINHLLGNGRESRADGEAHLIMAGDPDLSDHRGVWIPGVVTTAVLNRSDNSPTKMRFLIPWQYILGVGLDEGSAESVIGFTPGKATILINAESESAS